MRSSSARLPAALLSLLLLAGCSGGQAAEEGEVVGCPPDTLRQNVIVVVGTHANMPRPTLTPTAGTPSSPDLTCALEHLLIEGGGLTVIGVDGQPRAIARQIDPMSTKASQQNSPGWKRVLRDEHSNLDEFLDVKAEHEGADLYRALELALRSAARDPEGTAVFVLDNGLSDRGVVDLTQQEWFANDLDVAVETLTENGPPLQESPGTTVVLSGMASTAPPQEPLGIGQERAVAAIWTELLQRTGASVRVDPATWGRGEPNPTDLATRIVDSYEETVEAPEPPTVTELDPDSLGFEPDEAVPHLRSGAVAALQEFVDYLREAEPDVGLYVIGRTDSMPTQRWGSNERLSQARADAVRDILVDMGADPARIVSVGHGYVGCPPDGGAKKADLAKRKKNRVVIVGVLDPKDAEPPTGCFLE